MLIGQKTLWPKLTPDMHLAAVENNGMALQYINTKFRPLASPELYFDLCLAAVKQNGHAIQYVLTEKLNDHMYFELCRVAIRENGSAIEHLVSESKLYVFNSVEKLEFLTGLVTDAVRADGLNLRYIKNYNQSTQLCRIAVEQNPAALEFVSEPIIGMQTWLFENAPETMVAAFERDGLAIRFITADAMSRLTFSFKTRLLSAAVCQSGFALRYIAPADQTPELCYLAVAECGLAIQFITKNNNFHEGNIAKLKEIIETAVAQTPLARKFVPKFDFADFDPMHV